MRFWPEPPFSAEMVVSKSQKGTRIKYVVIISNGFCKFHLSVAAAECERRGLLSSFLTGAYPTPLMRGLLELPFIRDNPKIGRLSARKEEISDCLVHTFYLSEALYEFGRLRNSDATIVESFRFYGRLAVHHVKQAAAKGARIYHYRAGFGGDSVKVARQFGMYTLCDHSIAHPALVDALVANKGALSAMIKPDAPGTFWSYVLSDLEQADSILVNSHFVEETFRIAGQDNKPVDVIYLGVDDAFLSQVPPRRPASKEFTLLFAGNFESRKGAEVLIKAMARISDVPLRLEIAGPLNVELGNETRDFFSNPRVKYLGVLSRKNLAAAMTRADVFVFPSLAEGSARVVFEAIACGCYIITTPNSGSIVENGIHGSVIPPGDSNLLAEAIVYAFEHRDLVSELGVNNSDCVQKMYRQFNYGEQLTRLYQKCRAS